MRAFGLPDGMADEKQKQVESFWDGQWFGQIRDGMAAYYAAGREADARKATDTVLKLDPRDEVRVAVIEGTLLAGKPQPEHRAWLDDIAQRNTINNELRARWDKAMADQAK
jgi:hypothetical protein